MKESQLSVILIVTESLGIMEERETDREKIPSIVFQNASTDVNKKNFN